MYKKTIILILVTIALTLLTSCSSTPDKEEENYTIKFSHTEPEDHPGNLAAQAFKDELEDNSNGRITVEVRGNGELYDSETDAAEAVQLNNVQAAIPTTADISNFVPEYSLLNLPFLFDSKEEARETLDGEVGNKLNEKLSKKNLIGLGFGENGFRHYFNNKHPIEKPEDFSGMTTRVIENDLYIDMFKFLGADPAPLAFGELYSALEQGTYDGTGSEVTIASAEHFDEVTEYLSLTSHTYTAKELIINKDFFEDLPDDLQDMVDDAGETFSEKMRKETDKQEDKRLKELKKNMKVNELTEDQKDAFKKKLKPIYNKYAEEIDSDLVDAAEGSNN